MLWKTHTNSMKKRKKEMSEERKVFMWKYIIIIQFKCNSIVYKMRKYNYLLKLIGAIVITLI